MIFHNEIVCGFPTCSHVRATVALQMKEWDGFLFSLDASLLILGIPAGPSPSLSGYPYQDVPEIQADTIQKSNQLELFSVVKTKATKIKILNNDQHLGFLITPFSLLEIPHYRV